MNENPVYATVPPANCMKTNRGWLKTLLLSILTLGIYSIVFFSGISTDINLIASRYDGKKTMHYCLLLFVLAPITGTVAAFVWSHRLSRRGLPYRFGAGTFWGWNVLGALFIAGPFIYLHKLCKAMNLLCDDYNLRG